jgi:hypothetical protein
MSIGVSLCALDTIAHESGLARWVEEMRETGKGCVGVRRLGVGHCHNGGARQNRAENRSAVLP